MNRRLVPWILIASLPLVGWWAYGLFDLDEGFYAAIVAEMNRRGEWVTPFYNGQPWFEKPILLFWAAKPCLALFGPWIGPRLPSILATIGLYATVAGFARRRISVGAAILCCLVLGSSLLVVAAGRMMLTDPLLVLCMTGAFLSFWESLVGERRWRLATAACLGLAVLAKGPVAILLFAPVAGWTYWRQPFLRPSFRGYWLPGTAILLAIVATWYVPAYLQNGQLFVQKFLIEQNVGRFTGGDQAHTVRGIGGLLFYPLILLVGFAPWSFRISKAWSLKPGEGPRLDGYLQAWILIILGFFTVSGAKLPHYILPVIPPLAMLVAADLDRRWAGELTPKRLAAPLAWLAFIGVFAQWGFSHYYYGLEAFGLRLPGFHAEVHRLALFVREHAEPNETVAEFQMSRRERAMGTGKPKIQETSHPSTLLYLDRTILDTDDWSRIAAIPGRVWILTRWDRLTPDEQAAVGSRLAIVDAGETDLYRLYVLEAK